MKLSKAQIANHNKALELIKKPELTETECEFVLINYNEGAEHTNSSAGAFFTPLAMSWAFATEAMYYISDNEITIIDLCAGIGTLSYTLVQRLKRHNVEFRMVCVEINKDYYEVGKKLIPEAEWYNEDATNLEFLKSLGSFDLAISNPPFGNVGSMKGKKTPLYSGSHAEYKVIDVANVIADYGLFILPQESTGFKFSGIIGGYQETPSTKYKTFSKSTNLNLELSTCIDTSDESMYYWEYDDGVEVQCNWKNVNPVVEFVSCEFNWRK